ncbi:hypothetical protein PVK06_007624 [Gossypium arboreum]|uniref:Uncharacterized protein n=1 Tax=Gossypium arboreum TaxID=29729 RepID=A0ABR0QIS8_GOSAR|nr:hypothetical protein PVK06_007624 [Gossypium arboreum]
MVGKGMMTMFWEDIWYCNRPLKLKFPRLFCLARQKKGMVVDYSSKNGFNSVNWGEFFTRTLLDREVVMLRRLEDMVRSIELVLELAANEEVVGCGGVLRDIEGVARALFSGPISANDVDSTEAGAVFIALDLFLSMR